ncbi:MAG: hypothetical protein K2Q18_15600 [Bdellovibrionales bacterium]|nr:hypothetical protein [Bdellovibrionales bacterium]
MICSGEYPLKNTSFHQQQLNYLMLTLPWTNPPEVITGKGPDNWLNPSWKNPVIINLSIFPYEDFGVSLAEAQCKGWPAVLSAWGGHLDAQTSSTLFIPHSKIPKYLGQSPVLDYSAKRVSKLIAELWENQEKIGPAKKKKYPEVLDRPVLEKKLSKLNGKKLLEMDFIPWLHSNDEEMKLFKKYFSKKNLSL